MLPEIELKAEAIGRLRLSLKRSLLSLKPPEGEPSTEAGIRLSDIYPPECLPAIAYRGRVLFAARDFDDTCYFVHQLYLHGYTAYESAVWPGSDAEYYRSLRAWPYICDCLKRKKPAKLHRFCQWQRLKNAACRGYGKISRKTV
ncbi:fibroblast growth factor [Paralysiella testudinis]|uniref:Uncharacterized protein n=1 Tax=Paralysiella testudinis TaxID=2809020 RepID=A0A892ZK54_9NEIS|nr:fibroblast growth factor [Paralysiella testudinis]QRQ82840.1 hypothetical protein JQU52_05515 [Paralysiella testudinis]